jgi:hypothetical protein|tara:strand:+ start:852 stop:1067 length:216 start_codon:yes stop_codon:yes gene_type:complete
VEKMIDPLRKTSVVNIIYSTLEKYSGKQLNYDAVWFDIATEISDAYIDILGTYIDSLIVEHELQDKRRENE